MSTAFSVLDLAKQGDINAIATLIKNKLESKGIRVKFDCVQGDIKLFLESSQLGGKGCISVRRLSIFTQDKWVYRE